MGEAGMYDDERIDLTLLLGHIRDALTCGTTDPAWYARAKDLLGRAEDEASSRWSKAEPLPADLTEEIPTYFETQPGANR